MTHTTLCIDIGRYNFHTTQPRLFYLLSPSKLFLLSHKMVMTLEFCIFQPQKKFTSVFITLQLCFYIQQRTALCTRMVAGNMLATQSGMAVIVLFCWVFFLPNHFTLFFCLTGNGIGQAVHGVEQIRSLYWHGLVCEERNLPRSLQNASDVYLWQQVWRTCYTKNDGARRGFTHELVDLHDMSLQQCLWPAHMKLASVQKDKTEGPNGISVAKHYHHTSISELTCAVQAA